MAKSSRTDTKSDAAFPRRGHDHHRCVADALSQAEGLCAQRGARLTEIRKQVLELVWESHAPIGAYQILEKLAEIGKRPAPIAVYRALDFLMEQGLVHRLASRNAFLGCGHPDTNHQAQFLICDSCGSVAELADSRIVDAIADRAGRSGFAVAGHVVEIQGTCPDCRKAAHAG